MREIRTENKQRPIVIYEKIMSVLYKTFIQTDSHQILSIGKYMKKELDNGFNPNYHPKDKYTLLQASLQVQPDDNYQEYIIPTILLDFGADPNITVTWGGNALHTAVYFNHNNKLIQRLIHRIENIDYSNKLIAKKVPYTALCKACTCYLGLIDEDDNKMSKYNCLKNIISLIDAGASTDILKEFLRIDLYLKSKDDYADAKNRIDELYSQICLHYEQTSEIQSHDTATFERQHRTAYEYEL